MVVWFELEFSLFKLGLQVELSLFVEDGQAGGKQNFKMSSV